MDCNERCAFCFISVILNSFFSFQVKSGKELKAFLFNDFLMLTRPRSSITGNLSKKIGFNEQEVIYDIYRKVRLVCISFTSVDLPISSPEFPPFWSKETKRTTPQTKSKTCTRTSCFPFHCTHWTCVDRITGVTNAGLTFLVLTKKIAVSRNEIGDVYEDVYSLCVFVSRLESLTLVYRFSRIPAY